MKLGLVTLTCAVFMVAAPVVALAQAGFYITPSLRLSEEFDENVFVTASGQRADFITRFTPGVELGYRSEPFTLLAGSSFDAEVFADNSQLDDALDYARTDAILLGTSGPVEVETISASAEMEPLKLLTVRVEPSYTRTFGGVLERISTLRVYGLGLSAAYPITSWLTARAAYRFAWQQEAGPDIHHNLVTVSLEAAYPIRITS